MKGESEIQGFSGEKLTVEQIMEFGAVLETERANGALIRYQGNVYSVSEETVEYIKKLPHTRHVRLGMFVVPKKLRKVTM